MNIFQYGFIYKSKNNNYVSYNVSNINIKFIPFFEIEIFSRLL